MKKRVLSILLCVCMVLMLCPVTAFADEGYYTITQNFKYGAYQRAGVKVETSPYTHEETAIATFSLGTVEDCGVYEFVGWKETGSGAVYKPYASILAESNLTFDAVYQVQGSLAITIDGFEVGKTPADCTFSFESTIPDVTFNKSDITRTYWEECCFDGIGYYWEELYGTNVFEADTVYRVVIELNNKGLELAPSTTVNGIEPFTCWVPKYNGVPYAIQIGCELGKPVEPTLAVTIDGFEVGKTLADIKYSFASTIPGIEFSEDDIKYVGWEKFAFDGYDYVPVPVNNTEVFEADTSYRCAIELDNKGLDTAPAVTVNGKTPRHYGIVTRDGVPFALQMYCELGTPAERSQYTITYDGGEGVEGSIPAGVKARGEDFTLSSETFVWDGFIQTGWIDKETGAIYELGDTYDEDRDVTLYPYWEKLVTVTAPFTMTVEQGGNTAPGKADFDLELIDCEGNELTFDDRLIGAEITTNGVGDYSGEVTITATAEWLYDMLYEGAFIWQYDGEEEGWTYDDTVWGVRLYVRSPEIAARSVSEAQYSLLIYPAKNTTDDGFFFDLDMNAGTVEEMTFTNTYTKNTDLPEDEETTEIPNTGDSSNLALWFALLAVSAAGVIVMVVYSRRKGNCKTK